MLKSSFVKVPPKRFLYRSHKTFNQNHFLYDLEYSLKESSISKYVQYENIFTSVLDRHVPLETTNLRGNNQQQVTKHLRKQIMKRPRLKNKAIK